jgi:hypothetical protein
MFRFVLFPNLLFRYIDLINGPSAHRGDHGYSSVNRLSTFFIIVKSKHQFDISFTGTLPQNSRIRQPTATDNDVVLLSIYIARSQRIEVYREGMLIRPNNAIIDKQGTFSYNYPDQKYIPDLADIRLHSGANYFDRSAQTLHLAVRGDVTLDLKTSQTVVVNMETSMEMTPEELYSQKQLGPILANILGISQSFVKVVNIKSDEKTNRRRRSVGEKNRAELMFEIGSLLRTMLQSRSAAFSDDKKDRTIEEDMSMDELISIRNKMMSTRTVCQIQQDFRVT